MLFNSYIFIFLFLPITVVGWFLLNKCSHTAPANIFLIGMSLWFYGYFNPSYLLIICSSIIFNYAISRLLSKTDLPRMISKTLLTIGIGTNIGCIFYFKYYDFFITNVNTLFHQSFNLKHIILPLGISFFTFQQISYLVDSYNGHTKDYHFIEYALFVSFFPQLVAGPIVLHQELIPQFRNKEKRKFQHENFAHGLYLFALGLFKKIILADTFGKAVSWGFDATIRLSALETILISLAYTLQLYFDFSGYCDMAKGIGKMLNIELPENFNSPYKATSIPDFWNRWHMSLTRFLREYIYFPLGGSKKGPIRTYINIMIVYMISGIWHGANWTFVLWGFLHGIANCTTRMCKKYWNKLHMVTQWFITFVTVNILWVFFRAKSIVHALQILKPVFRMDSFTISHELLECFVLPETILLEELPFFYLFVDKINGFYMWSFFAIGMFAVLNLKNSKEINFKPTISKGIQTITFLIWSIVSLSGISTFLYFDF